MLAFACLGLATSSAGGFTQFLFPGANSTACGTANGVEIPIPVPGTLKNLYVNAGAVAANTAVIGVYLNNTGSVTALKCILTGLSTCNDTADSVSVVAGDTISIRLKLTGTTTETLTQVRASVQLQ